MKKVLIVFGLVLGFATTVYAKSFCCSGSKEECCAAKGKMYCPQDNSCRTRCLEVAAEAGSSNFCEGGCINPEGKCCDWCPSAEVCQEMGKCQKIGVDGCYTCGTCEEECPAPKCMNQDGVCCSKCPRTCPEGECLTNVDGCYVCGECKKPLPDDDDDDDADDDDVGDDDDADDDDADDDDADDDDADADDDDDDDDADDDDGCVFDGDCGHCEICVQGYCQVDLCCEVSCDLINCEECNPETGICESGCGYCEKCEAGSCVSGMTTKQTGECCDEGEVPCCPLTENCECYPTKDDCDPDDDDDADDDDADDDVDDDDDDDVDDDDADDDDDVDDDVDDDDDPPCKKKEPCDWDSDCCGDMCVNAKCCPQGTFVGTEEECEIQGEIQGLCYSYNDGCPICGACNPDDDDDDDDRCVSNEDCEYCEACEGGVCVDKMSTRLIGECCDEDWDYCCPLTENCECFPTKDDCNPDDDDDDVDDDDDDVSCDNLTWDTNKCEYCEDGEIKDWCPGTTQCCKGTCYDIVCDPCEEFNWETCCCEPVSDPHCGDDDDDDNIGCNPACDLTKCYVCDNASGNCVFGCSSGYSCCAGGQCRKSCGGGGSDDDDDDDDTPNPPNPPNPPTPTPTPDDDDDPPPTGDDDDDDVDDDDVDDDDVDDDVDDDDEPLNKCVDENGNPIVFCKDCKECDPKTGLCTIPICTDPAKPECCNNKCYAKCEGRKVRNSETCACECPPGEEECGFGGFCCKEGEYCYSGDAASLTGALRCCPNIKPVDEENCLTEICSPDPSVTGSSLGCPYRCSKCGRDEICSNGHCCPEGEVYIMEAQMCCPSARDCGHFCCGEGEYCASMDAVCCKEGETFNEETGKCEGCPEGYYRYISMDAIKTLQGGTSIWDSAVNLVCSDVYDSYQTAPNYKCCKEGWDVKQISKEETTLNANVPLYGEIACVIITTTKNACVCEEPKVVCGEDCCEACNKTGDGCCENTYTSYAQKDGIKRYACCDDENMYIKTAETSSRGVQACCSEGGVAFVDYPWSSSTHSVYWFEEDPEYGMINKYSNCCMHELADNAYGGQDCCTPISEYNYATSSSIYMDTTPTVVKDYDFEICCPEGREAYYTGTVTMTNDDTGESKAYPKGACCREGEVVVKYGKYNDVNNYTCCNVSEDSNRVRVAVQGAPEEDFEVCCEKYTSYSSGEGTIPEAYWSGNAGICCYGTVYQSKEGVWECCEDIVSTSAPYGQNVCDVENAPVGGDIKDCCPRYKGVDGVVKDGKSFSYDGISTGADSQVYCCSGTPYHSANNGAALSYNCCPEVYITGLYDYVEASSAEQVASLKVKGYTCEQYSDTSYYCWRDWSDFKIEGTVTKVTGIPGGRETETCCSKVEYSRKTNETDKANEYIAHDLAGAYWNGQQSNCCFGTIYDRLKDETLPDAWGCCNEWDGYGVVSVQGNPPSTSPHKLCCGSYKDDGVTKIGKAYWSGSYSTCCYGEIYKNKDGTYRCCPAPYKYDFETKKEKYEDGDCSPVLTGEHTCCPCGSEQIWDYETETCVNCPEGTKANCYECITTATNSASGYGGCPYSSSSSSTAVCYTLKKGQHVSCTSYSTGSTDNCGYVSSGYSCSVCPTGKSYYMDFSNNSFDYGCK